jgi:hypothetical protein
MNLSLTGVNMYYWSDISAIGQLKISDSSASEEDDKRSESAEKYLVARLQGASTENANTIARESE